MVTYPSGTALVPPGAKITARHRERRAYVYVRQSTPEQVQHHRESQREPVRPGRAGRRPGLAARAGPRHRRRPGAVRPGRRAPGLPGAGGRGLARPASASSWPTRPAGWRATTPTGTRLLDLATVRRHAHRRREGVYDPRSYNDRLLLGLRGMLSEAELHLLRLRLDAGRLRQVERGDLPPAPADRAGPPARRAGGQGPRPAGAAHPRPGLRALRRAGHLPEGAAQPARRRPAASRAARRAACTAGRAPLEAPHRGDGLYEILRNPAYAGAFVYGRRRPHPDRRPGQPPGGQPRRWRSGRSSGATPTLPTCPGSSSWPTRQRLADNASRFARRARGAARTGPALLAGLVVCGRCGRQMQRRLQAAARATSATAPGARRTRGPPVPAPGRAEHRGGGRRRLLRGPAAGRAGPAGRGAGRPGRPTASAWRSSTPTRWRAPSTRRAWPSGSTGRRPRQPAGRRRVGAALGAGPARPGRGARGGRALRRRRRRRPPLDPALRGAAARRRRAPAGAVGERAAARPSTRRSCCAASSAASS